MHPVQLAKWKGKGDAVWETPEVEVAVLWEASRRCSLLDFATIMCALVTSLFDFKIYVCAIFKAAVVHVV